MLTTTLLAFFEGVALIASPCILPVLPIVLAGSLTGNKARPIGIIIGFILTFTIITMTSRTLFYAVHINPDILRYCAFVVLALLGLIMLIPALSERLTLLTQGLTRIGSQRQTFSRDALWSGLLFGGLVGIIWTPCAGPILAAVIVQVVLQKTTLASLLTVLAFAIGTSIPMLLIAWFGRAIIDKVSFLHTQGTFIRQLLGIIILLSIIFLFYDNEEFLSLTQTSETPAAPTTIATEIESKTPDNVNLTTVLASPNQEAAFADKSADKISLKEPAPQAGKPMRLVHGLEKPIPAPEIAGITAWINSTPLSMAQLHGKVVLIDFWTYSCINCIRTLPYLKEWYAKYHQYGLEVIGIHSPEFAFEHNVNNVKAAVKKFGILYPVALDNRFTTWQNFYNSYWPAHYLIDQAGNIVYIHFGEGAYEVTENNIRFLLGLNKLSQNIKGTVASAGPTTPETYLGYDRADRFQNIASMTHNRSKNYTYPERLDSNHWALQGGWTVYADRIIAASKGASLKIHFNGAKVFAVMGAKHPIQVAVSLNGEPLPPQTDVDVSDSHMTVEPHQLYRIINASKAQEAELELMVNEPGVEIYTFTFG